MIQGQNAGRLRLLKELAAAKGFEPSLTESKSVVLPLHYTAMYARLFRAANRIPFLQYLYRCLFPTLSGTQNLTLNAGLAEVTGVEPAFTQKQ